jgi:hypothetical protein
MRIRWGTPHAAAAFAAATRAAPSAMCTHRHPDGKVVLLARTTGNGLISRILQPLRKLFGILEQFVVSASWRASMHGQCHGLQVSSAERVRAGFAARPFACNPAPPAFPTPFVSPRQEEWPSAR